MQVRFCPDHPLPLLGFVLHHHDFKGTTKEGTPYFVRFAQYNEPNLVRLFINYGADVHIKDSKGDTALYWAKILNYTDIQDILKETGAKY